MDFLKNINYMTISTMQGLGISDPHHFVERLNELGAPFILIPFILLQIGVLRPGFLFSMLNAIGGSLFLIFFLVKWGPGGIVLESFFVAFGLWGMWKAVRNGRENAGAPA